MRHPRANHLVAALFCAFSLLTFIPQSAAQTASYQMGQYNDKIKTLINNRNSASYEFVKLRRLYSQIDDYEPDGLSVINEMNAMAPTINPNSAAANDVIKFDRFKRLMLTHMGNIAVVENAVGLAARYPDILNQEQLRYILAGLRESLTLSGDGRAKRTAFDLYTLEEESALLESLNMRLIYKAIQKEGPLSFAIYRTKDKQTGEDHTIYANITAHTDKLQNRLEEEDKKAAPIEGR